MVSEVGWVRLRGECSLIDDERRIHRSSSGCHVADSDVAHGMNISKGKGADNSLCMVTALGVVTVRRHGVVGVGGGGSWMMVVVKEERCGLLMAPKSSIGVC